MASTDTGDNILQTSTAEPRIMKYVSVVVIPEAATVTIPEVPVITLALKEPTAGLVPALSETASALTDTVCTITERGFGSVSTRLAPAMDIMK